MAVLQFPLNPTTGQIYSVGVVSWQWNGFAWSRLPPTTQSTSTNTGALVVAGGVGIAGDVQVGGTVYSGGDKVLTTATFIDLISTSSFVVNSTSTLQIVSDHGSTTTNVITFSNTSSSTSTNSGAIIVAGGAGIGGDLWVNGSINSKSVKISESIIDSVVVSINTTATTIVDSYSVLQFRSAKYLIQIDEEDGPTSDFQVIEILLLVDNVGTVYATEYALLTSNGDMGEFAADVQDDNLLRLYFTSYHATSKVLKILRTGMTV
jgi:hypothetical protein